MRKGGDYSEHGAKVVAEETPNEPIWVAHDGGVQISLMIRSSKCEYHPCERRRRSLLDGRGGRSTDDGC